MSSTNLNSMTPHEQEFLNRFILEGFINEIPESLYHYTDSRGLHGILSNQSIWLTSFKFMNDYREFTHGLEFLDKKLMEFLSTNTYDPSFVQMCKNILDFIRKESLDPELKPYIFCLTKKSDHLSQWRGYGDFGKGFCLKYNVSALLPLQNQGVFLGKVQYQPDMLEALMADLVQQWLLLCSNVAQTNSNNITSNAGQNLAILLMQAAYAIAIKMKHHGFEEEEEWRLFSFAERGSQKLKFRPHRFGIADYIELNIDPHHFINEIMSGPCGPDLSYLKSSIESLVKSPNASRFSYIKSPIPFV